jgi:hypothetical protein
MLNTRMVKTQLYRAGREAEMFNSLPSMYQYAAFVCFRSLHLLPSHLCMPPVHSSSVFSQWRWILFWNRTDESQSTPLTKTTRHSPLGFLPQLVSSTSISPIGLPRWPLYTSPPIHRSSLVCHRVCILTAAITGASAHSLGGLSFFLPITTVTTTVNNPILITTSS